MPRRSAGKDPQPRTVRDLAVLMVKIEQFGLENAPVSLLRRAIAKAFGFQEARMQSTYWFLRTEGSEIYLTDAKEFLRVPEPMRDLVKTWMRRAVITQ